MQAGNLQNVSYWIKYIPAWIIAITACIGLHTWKKKLSYERKMSIVDDFHEAVNDFFLKTNDIIEVLTVMQIAIQSYEKIFQIDSQKKINFVNGLHEFVESNSGESYSNRLKTLLMHLPMQRVYILSTKISALQMKNSGEALNCYKQLNRFYDRVQKTTNLLSMKQLYWKNPSVVERMSQLKQLDIDVLKKSLHEANHLMLEFARQNYK
ncbi:MAG: hypothetical protein KAS93_02450 [Gammaproteobacteria bacterium]|nr:hypothetical protein [Gammaproteobacteria bacterium]